MLLQALALNSTEGHGFGWNIFLPEEVAKSNDVFLGERYIQVEHLTLTRSCANVGNAQIIHQTLQVFDSSVTPMPSKNRLLFQKTPFSLHLDNPSLQNCFFVASFQKN